MTRSMCVSGVPQNIEKPLRKLIPTFIFLVFIEFISFVTFTSGIEKNKNNNPTVNFGSPYSALREKYWKNASINNSNEIERNTFVFDGTWLPSNYVLNVIEFIFFNIVTNKSQLKTFV